MPILKKYFIEALYLSIQPQLVHPRLAIKLIKGREKLHPPPYKSYISFDLRDYLGISFPRAMRREGRQLITDQIRVSCCTIYSEMIAALALAKE